MCNLINLISYLFPNMGKIPSEELANVYIFNKIENNKADVDLLCTTFVLLNCVVREIKVQNKTYAELKDCVKEIIKGDFKDFGYIVVIILDNNNDDEHTWITEDQKVFHFNGDLLTAISANKSLEGKFRFFILQTNRVPSENMYRRNRQLCKPKLYSGIEMRYYATSWGCVIKHEWKEGEPSPFIRSLCDQIDRNINLPIANQLPIDRLLDNVSQQQTEERPAITPLGINGYVLRNAR